MSTELRALIVDDEPLSRRAMQQLLALHPDVRVVASCGDTLEAMPHLSGVDVVFLDVQLPGASGLDLARTLTSGGPPFVVFVTAFEAYAVPAFDTEALDYLQKPVAPERLAKALKIGRAHV